LTTNHFLLCGRSGGTDDPLHAQSLLDLTGDPPSARLPWTPRPEDGALSGYPGSNFCGLAALALPDGPRLFVADNIHNLIHAFRLD
jgi:hypothetical protein